jgi:hypothetical protein
MDVFDFTNMRAQTEIELTGFDQVIDNIFSMDMGGGIGNHFSSWDVGWGNYKR